jgi:hypothetical protein
VVEVPYNYPYEEQQQERSTVKRGNQISQEILDAAEYNPIYEAQTLTYLRLMKLHLDLVINFGESLVKDGYYRVANNL